MGGTHIDCTQLPSKVNQCNLRPLATTCMPLQTVQQYSMKALIDMANNAMLSILPLPPPTIIYPKPFKSKSCTAFQCLLPDHSMLQPPVFTPKIAIMIKKQSDTYAQ
eukprot:scaffold236602_cov22-Prasinocladus_malaysianus.AAC.1